MGNADQNYDVNSSPRHKLSQKNKKICFCGQKIFEEIHLSTTANFFLVCSHVIQLIKMSQKIFQHLLDMKRAKFFLFSGKFRKIVFPKTIYEVRVFYSPPPSFRRYFPLTSCLNTGSNQVTRSEGWATTST